jgi:energy-coupling factor transporter ATP-binding protein EcfA2
MQNIEKLHESIFTFLDRWSERSRSGYNDINPYFYMRSVRDERFKKGYWFPGNENYICLSFWAGGDSNNKTPNIYFDIHEKYGCRIMIVAKDSESKYTYFHRLVKHLNEADSNAFITKNKVWVKVLTNKWQEWENWLSYFLINDKRRIDEFIDNNEFTDFEEFVSRFGFISAKDFDIMFTRVLKERDEIRQKEYEKHQVYVNQPKLPYALLGINIENFQGVQNTSVNDLRADARWIFITGENGYGKTTILQAIALGASNDPGLEKYLDDKSRISLELSSRNEKAFPIRTKGALNIGETFDYGQYVIGYGPARLNVQSKSSENFEARGNIAVLSLFENDTLLKNINYELFATNFVDQSAFVELQEIIQSVTENRVSEIIVDKRQVLFSETLSNGEKLQALPLNKLAAGFRSIINIVIDIYLRMKKVHFGIPFREFYGIVLIDEIENHLHPILQKELPLALSRVFPKIQFIISTHSPIPLLAAERNSIILKVNRNKPNGVTIERLDEIIDFPNLLPNTILTSPIFGFQDIFAENKSSEQFVRPEDTYQELLENDEQNKKIKEHLSKETTESIMKFITRK